MPGQSECKTCWPKSYRSWVLKLALHASSPISFRKYGKPKMRRCTRSLCEGDLISTVSANLQHLFKQKITSWFTPTRHARYSSVALPPGEQGCRSCTTCTAPRPTTRPDLYQRQDRTFQHSTRGAVDYCFAKLKRVNATARLCCGTSDLRAERRSDDRGTATRESRWHLDARHGGPIPSAQRRRSPDRSARLASLARCRCSAVSRWGLRNA
jgi:hypothetical protein